MDNITIEKPVEATTSTEAINALIDEVTEIIEGKNGGDACCVACNRCHFCR